MTVVSQAKGPVTPNLHTSKFARQLGECHESNLSVNLGKAEVGPVICFERLGLYER